MVTSDPILGLPLTRPRASLALAVLLTCAFGAAAGWRGVRMDVRIEKIFPQQHPGLAVYERFRAQFGRDDELAFVMLELPQDVLSRASLARIHSLTVAVRELPLVDERRVVSLSSAPFVRIAPDGALDIGPLYEPDRADGWDAEAVAALVAENPAFAGRLLSADRRLAGFLVPLTPIPEKDRTKELRRRFAREVRAFFGDRLQPGERVWFDGFAITYDTVYSMLQEDVRLFFPLAIGILLVSLGLLLRRPRVTLLCVLTLLGAVVWTFGSMALLDIPLNMISASCLPIMILVVCVGDAVHLVTRAQQLRAAGAGAPEALAGAVHEVGRACFFTSVTTAAGFASLYASQVEVVRELGVPTALGILYAYALTFMVLPPVLTRTDVGVGAGGLGAAAARPLAAIAALTARAPGRVVAGAGLLLVAAAALIPSIDRENRLLQDFDPDEEIMATRLMFEERMGGIAPLELVVDAGQPGGAYEPDVIQGLYRLTRTLRSERFRQLGVLFALSLPDYLADAYWTLEDRRPDLRYTLPDRKAALAQLRFVYELSGEDPTRSLLDDPDEPQVLRLQMRVRNLKTTPFMRLLDAIEAEARAELPPSVHLELTGNTRMSQGIHESLVHDMLTSFALAFVLVGGLVLIFFRSPGLALLGMIPNLVPLVLVLGCMPLLGFALTMSTSIVFTVIFGISVDDTIHFVAALQHNRQAGEPDPIGTTIRRTGASLALSSLVLVLGFGVLCLSQFRPNRYFGVMTGLTVVFALLGDLILLPALLRLMSRWREEPGPGPG